VRSAKPYAVVSGNVVAYSWLWGLGWALIDLTFSVAALGFLGLRVPAVAATQCFFLAAILRLTLRMRIEGRRGRRVFRI
jgi:hypothetical protein